jgi:hypothetical protein
MNPTWPENDLLVMCDVTWQAVEKHLVAVVRRGVNAIEYDNMVHNVVSIDAILADGSEARFESLKNPAHGARLERR